MTFTILSLPNPLILLIHLHILEYPHANNPEYDHNIFNPRVRGLKERIKLMEDISYFLVGRIEGGKPGAKTHIRAFNHRRLAFRTSLSKYLDNLRHQAIYSNTSGTKYSNTHVKGKDPAPRLDMAWWWKDVTVRRSLLEECVGEKFERVLLALSTHALMKKSSTQIALDATSSLFRSQPLTYATNLAKYQSKRHAWSQRASLLTRRQEDLARLHLLPMPLSRYASFSIRQLQAISESKIHNLLEGQWAGKEGREALNLFIELAGLKSSTDGSQEVAEDPPIEKNPPLPVAAAHHPSHLKKIRRPVFQTKSTAKTPSRSHAEIKLSDSLESEKRMRKALIDSISRIKGHRVELVNKVEALKSIPATPTLDFWTIPSFGGFDWDPRPTREMFESLSLPVPPEDDELTLETQIQHIRQDLLFPYPPIPDPSAPRLLSLETKVQSRIPRQVVVAPRSVKRKSIRFSMARKGRPSIFRMQDVVDQLVDATEDHSDYESDPEFGLATPKAKVKNKINRIWTSGTPKSAIKNTPRESFPMTNILMEPALSLPSLLSTELETNGSEQDSDFTPMARRRRSCVDEENVFDEDPPSMTLREILLNADTSHFHLLEEEDEGDGVLSGDDTSFVWE